MLDISLMDTKDYDVNRPFLMEGFRRILGTELSEEIEQAYDDKIRKKATSVFLVSSDSRYPFGFFTIDFRRESGALVAVVTDGFNSGEIVPDVLEECTKVARRFALCAGADSLRFSSSREGWFRRAKKLGARLVRVTFEVDLYV